MRCLLNSALLFIFLSSVDACMRVTPGEPGIPATPCKNCADNLITVSRMNVNSIDMEGVTVRNGRCAVRTFTCTGRMASIGLWGVGDEELGSVTDETGAGMIAVAVTCNAAGSAWQYMGVTVTRVECVVAVPIGCQACYNEMTEISKTGMGAKGMDDDQITNPPPHPLCAVRTFTCMGMNAHIELFTGNRVSRGKVNDGAALATLALRCNAAGTGWESPELPGEPITAVECSIADDQPPPGCRACNKEMTAISTTGMGAKGMDDDQITNPPPHPLCAVRTFTCMGMNAHIELFTGNRVSRGKVNDGAALATLALKCNAAGTGWESDDLPGEPITTVECSIYQPSPVCTRCAMNLLEVRQDVEFGKPMADDRTTAACVRTFKCMGASIEIYGGNKVWLGQVTDLDSTAMAGMAEFKVQCNAAGDGWESPEQVGTTITSVACLQPGPPPCSTCDQAAIVRMEAAPNKDMDADITTYSGADQCAVRTFTCIGNNANIEYFTGVGVTRGNVNDGSMAVKFEAKCNAAGTAWESALVPGEPITSVACSIGAPANECTRCAMNLLEVREDVEFGKPMESDMTTAACVRTFKCMGESIEIYGGNKVWLGQVTDLDSTAMAGMAEFKVQCNAAGDGWESPEQVGTTITSVACVKGRPPPCGTCDDNAIALMEAAPYKSMDAAITTVPGGADLCQLRTFTCIGNNAKIDYFTGAGVNRGNVNDGSMTVKFEARCNAAGTAWESALVPGEPITSVACSVDAPVSRCKMCTQDMIMKTQLGLGSKPMTDDVTEEMGACSVRTFTCMGGMNAGIEIFTGARVARGVQPMVTVVCNDAGTGWEMAEIPGEPITSVECMYG